MRHRVALMSISLGLCGTAVLYLAYGYYWAALTLTLIAMLLTRRIV